MTWGDVVTIISSAFHLALHHVPAWVHGTMVEFGVSRREAVFYAGGLVTPFAWRVLLGLVLGIAEQIWLELRLWFARKMARWRGQSDRVFAGPANVIDGDTIEVGGFKVRIHGVDALEWTQPFVNRYGVEIQEYGRRIAEELRLFLRGRIVKCRRIDIDRHGRLVCVCRANGIDLGRWLIQKGYAVARGRRYESAEMAARRKQVGIWAGSFDDPKDWRAAAA